MLKISFISFKYKLFIAFLIYGLSLIFLTQFVVFKMNKESIKSLSIKEASKLFIGRDDFFKSYIKDTNLKISAIKNSDVFREYLSNSKDIDLVNSLFMDIAATSDNIMQLRYIDSSGMEAIRVDRAEFASKPYSINKEDLQDKSNRYYFKNIFDTYINSIWYSNLDLNIEYSEIEKPIKPVIRIGTPVYHDGEKRGILIVNIFMKNFLQELINIPLFDIYLFDGDGNILVNSVNKHSWSKYLENNETIYDFFANEAHLAIYNGEYISENFYSHKISLENNENIHMLIKPKNTVIQNEIDENIYELSMVMLWIFLLSFPFAYFFSKTPIRLKEEVDKRKDEQDVLLSLFDLSEAVLFKWNNDTNWSVNYVSKSVEKFLGYKQTDFTSGRISYSTCVHSDDIQRVMNEVNDAIESNVYFFEHEPYRVIHKDGTVKWILDSTVVVRNEDNEIINFIGYLTDITEMKNTEIILKNLSRTDQLTKISNRMHLDEVLHNQHYRFSRDGEITSIILIDIDYFKSVNDIHGHLVGDSVLIEFSNLLKSSIREGDVLGRWGGEEFLIILPYTDIYQTEKLAEKLRKKIENYNFTTVKHKTASFGLATFEKGMGIESILNIADSSLYQAKESGRNCIRFIQNNNE